MTIFRHFIFNDNFKLSMISSRNNTRAAWIQLFRFTESCEISQLCIYCVSVFGDIIRVWSSVADERVEEMEQCSGLNTQHMCQP